MKTLVALVVVLLVTAVVWWMADDTQPDSIVRDSDDMYETRRQAPATLPVTKQEEGTIDSEQTSQQVSAANREKMVQTKSRLDALMLTYDANLNNPQRRREIKQEIDQLLGEYDKLVLPVALEKMKNDKSSHGH